MNAVKLALPLVAMLFAGPVAGQSNYRSSLPVKPSKGVTVAGTVECDGRPVAGVTVSDGYEVTKTDKKGAYYLKSSKKNPQVFITPPGDYEVWREDAVPQFWADFTLPPGEFERHDFRLKPAANDKHAVIVFTDVHLANQRNDVEIFSTEYADTLKARAAALEKGGYTVYSFNLGDSAWDTYWASNGYLIGDFRKTLNDIGYPTAVYSCMGNHDNDPSAPFGDESDMIASLPYQKAFGPRYYSLNIGKVHYIFLDNVRYINEPSDVEIYKGLMNKRNYTEGLTEEQLDWMRKDLKDVGYDTPVVLAMHCPMFRWKDAGPRKDVVNLSDKVVVRSDSAPTMQLLEILRPYKNVHSFAGHSHKQCLVRVPEEVGSIVEHNISGVCGAWWHTRATGLKNLCPDGTPVAYETLTADDTDLRWKHHTFEFPEDMTFLAWDMNGVKDYFRNNNEMKVFHKLYPKWTDYSSVPDNTVYINLWEWDPEGELTVTENGVSLPVEKILVENPLLVASYVLRNAVWRNEWDKPGHAKPQKYILFKAQASTPDAPLEIVWKDCFGRESRQTLERPAPFTLQKLND